MAFGGGEDSDEDPLEKLQRLEKQEPNKKEEIEAIRAALMNR